MSLTAAIPGGSAQFLAGNLVGDGVIAAGLSGQQNNLSPPGIEGATVVSLRPVEPLDISGMQAAPAFTIRWLKNDSSFVATLLDASAASSAPHRFNLGGTNVQLAPGLSAGLIYNGLTLRWDLLTVAAHLSAPSVVVYGPAATYAATAGSNNNVTPPTAISSINRLKINTASGDATVTGIVAGTDGQHLLVTNLGPAEVTLAVGNLSSAIANRIYGMSDITLPAANSQLLVYDSALARWIIA